MAGSLPLESVGHRTNRPLKFAMLVPKQSSAWSLTKLGAESAAAAQTKVAVQFVESGNEGSGSEIKRLQDLSGTGVDGIAIAPSAPNEETYAINLAAKKCLVLTYVADAPESDRACFVGADERAEGRQLGLEVRRCVPRGGQVVAVCRTPAGRERLAGFKDEIEGSNVNLIGTIDTLVSPQSMPGAKQLDCVVGLEDGDVAIARSVRRGSKARLVTFGADDETLNGVKSGEIASTVVEPSFEIGFRTISLMAQTIRTGHNLMPAHRRMVVPTIVVDATTVSKFKQTGAERALSATRGRRKTSRGPS